MTRVEAETLALNALTYLAQWPEEWERFLALSGIAPSELRKVADSPDTLAAVLDFLLGTDERVTGFCDAFGEEPRRVQAAQIVLSGP